MDEWAFLLERTLQSWRAAGNPSRVLAAVSGGADSVALLLVLAQLSREAGFHLECAHVDHGLRPTSARDAAFVADLCAREQVPCHVLPVRVASPGENGAREERYRALLALCQKTGAHALALAHHRQDQAETLLLHLFRGSGGAGLAGMRACRMIDGENGAAVCLWRPFLTLSPETIKAALRQKNRPWQEDETNAQDVYLRNYLRHQVLPAIRARVPDAEEAMARAAQVLAAEQDYFTSEAQSFLRDHACLSPPCRWIDQRALAAVHPALERHILRLACPVSLDFAQTEALLSLPMGKTANLPAGWTALRTPRFLHFLPPVREAPVPGRLRVLSPDGRTGDGKRVQAMPRAVYDQCTLRCRQAGDRIRPLGAGGTKSLQDYFTDRHIDRPFRDHVPLLCQGKRVIWAIGVGPGEEARWSPETDGVLLVYEGFLPGEMPGKNKQ